MVLSLYAHPMYFGSSLSIETGLLLKDNYKIDTSYYFSWPKQSYLFLYFSVCNICLKLVRINYTFALVRAIIVFWNFIFKVKCLQNDAL